MQHFQACHSVFVKFKCVKMVLIARLPLQKDVLFQTVNWLNLSLKSHVFFNYESITSWKIEFIFISSYIHPYICDLCNQPACTVPKQNPYFIPVLVLLVSSYIYTLHTAQKLTLQDHNLIWHDMEVYCFLVIPIQSTFVGLMGIRLCLFITCSLYSTNNENLHDIFRNYLG